jgi:hypothetical protein
MAWVMSRPPYARKHAAFFRVSRLLGCEFAAGNVQTQRDMHTHAFKNMQARSREMLGRKAEYQRVTYDDVFVYTAHDSAP